MSTPEIPGARRKRTRAKPPEQRKRVQYAPKACNSCKKRKTKCDGLCPCEQCALTARQCVYDVDSARSAPSPGPKQTPSIQPAEDPGNIRQATHMTGCTSHRDESRRSSLELRPSISTFVYCGPTSANYGFGIVQSMLRRYTSNVPDSLPIDTELAGSVVSDVAHHSQSAVHAWSQPKSTIHTLDFLDIEEAIRLVDVYQDIIGVFHPILDRDELVEWTKTALYVDEDQSSTLNRICLQMVLAIALLAEGAGHNEQAERLFDGIQPTLCATLLKSSFQLQDHIFLLLVGTYHLFHEDLRSASRIIAFAVRLIMEAGLHRRQILFHRYPDAIESKTAIIVLLTTVVLDRQLCFAAGLPYPLRDYDVDLENSLEDAPYLRAMSSYIRMGAQLWDTMLEDNGKLKSSFKDELFDFVEYKVQRWQLALPEVLHPAHVSASFQNDEVSKNRKAFSMRLLLYLRANQIRILVQRPILFTLNATSAHLGRVHRVIEAACDNIDTVVHLDRASDLYRKQQAIYNHFISSALSVLFLVVTHTLTKAIRVPQLREEACSCASVPGAIFRALDLLKSYSSTSRSARTLLQTIEGLRGLLTRLGALTRTQPQACVHQTACSLQTNESIAQDSTSGISGEETLEDWSSLIQVGGYGYDNAEQSTEQAGADSTIVCPPDQAWLDASSMTDFLSASLMEEPSFLFQSIW